MQGSGWRGSRAGTAAAVGPIPTCFIPPFPSLPLPLLLPTDLARDMRGTKLEAQPPARFIEADARVNDDVEVVVATAPASAPTSPARQRRQRGFATLV